MDTVEDRPEDAQVLREPRSPTGGEKTVKGQLLKIAVVLSVFLLIVWLFGFVFVAKFPPLPQGRALGWHGEIDEGSYVLTIISVGGYTESEKQLDKWWIRIGPLVLGQKASLSLNLRALWIWIPWKE